MKRAILRFLIILSSFVIALVVTSSIINQDSVDLTAELAQPSLPIVSIEYNGQEINRMYGYVRDMDLSYMRDSITPLALDRSVGIKVDTFGANVTGMAYELRTIDGARLIENTEILNYDVIGRYIDAKIVLKDLIENNKEYELIIVLRLASGKEAKYYTRAIIPEEYYINEKLNYVLDFSEKTLDKVKAESLKTYLEPNAQGDNSSFGYVDIHSNFKMFSWGELYPERITDPMVTINEIAPMTGSFKVEYDVRVMDAESNDTYYRVKEYFRVRYSTKRMYLLDYERTMDEIFVNVKASYNKDSISLGINSDNTNILESEDGNNFTFIANDRLYEYNITDNRVAYLFGFFDEYINDARMMSDNHAIKVINVDEAGNTTFIVYGYMSRGNHEGESGAEIFYYNADVNSIEELVYIPSPHAPDLLIKEIDELSYINSDGVLFISVGSEIYGINTANRQVDTIVSDLHEGGYAISLNNHAIAWQEGERYDCQKLVIRNLETGIQKDIVVNAGETLIPMAFIDDDLIYGIADKYDITKDRTGNTIVPMYQVNIGNETEGTLMEYHQDGVYITSAEVNGNQISLFRVRIVGDGIVEEIANDQIMNSEDIASTENHLGREVTDKYKTRNLLMLKKEINPTAVKFLTPKMVLHEGSREIDISKRFRVEPYVVYGKYGVDSLFNEADLAVSRAYDISGIVMNSVGEYVWIKTTRQHKNQIMSIKQTNVSEERGSLAVCLDTMIEHRGVIRNSQYMLNEGESVIDILESSLSDCDILDLSGCSLDMVLYYVNLDIPVLVMMEDRSAILIVGFNDSEIAVMNPNSEEIYKISIDEAVEWFDSNGNCFITYKPGQFED